MKIGFVGLGIMGRPMAHNLIKGGHELFVYGKRTVPPEIREAGATVCDTLKAVAEQAEVIIIMVPDTPDVQTCCSAPDGVAAGPVAGQDRRRHELDLADRDQGIRRRDRRRRAATMSMRRCRAARSAPRRRA